MNNLKLLCKSEIEKIRNADWPRVEKILAVFAILLLFVQFIHMAGMLYDLRQSKGMMNTRGDDASQAISVALNTKWYNTNKWYAYGPLYYRFTHTFANLISSRPLPNQTPNEVVEMNHHFILTLISLMAFFGVCYTISLVLFSPGFLRYLSTAALASSFLSSEKISTLVFTAHPDYLLILFLVWAFYFSERMMEKENNYSYFLFSAILWGLAASTKMTFVYFVTITPFFWRVKLNKEYISKLSIFYLLMFSTYMIVGFPQSLHIHKVLKFMKFMSGFTRPIDLEFFNIWMTLTWKQFHIPFLVLIILSFLPDLSNADEDNKNYFNKKITIKILGLSFIPLFLMYSRKLIHAYQHYLIPFLTIVIFTISMAVRSLKQDTMLIRPLGKILQMIYFSLFVLVLWSTIGFVPKSYYTIYNQQNFCYNETKEFFDEINSRLKNGGRMMSDPDVPFNSIYSSQVYNSYHKYLSHLKTKKPDYIALTSHGNSYMGEISEYIKQDIPTWKDVKNFFVLFMGKEQVIDPFGNIWKRTYLSRNKCNEYKIYEKIKK